MNEIIEAIGNLLAVIHRDGGHYAAEHGILKACADAERTITDERRALREAEAECDKLRARVAELEATKLEARNTWRVVYGGRVHVTHIEREVREAIRLGYKVRRLYSYEVNEWRDET